MKPTPKGPVLWYVMELNRRIKRGYENRNLPAWSKTMWLLLRDAVGRKAVSEHF